MKVCYISANPGDPSTLWQSESGKYYRTKNEAISDNGTEIFPEEFEIKKSALEKYHKLNIRIVAISAIVAFLVYKYIIKKA